MSRILMAIALAAIFGPIARSADETTTTNQTPAMKIRLKVGNKVLTATLADNKTARDFVSLLPLTLNMNDLFGREKFGHLPRAISEEGKRTHTCAIGIVIGKIDSGVEALNVPGSVKVTMELLEK